MLKDSIEHYYRVEEAATDFRGGRAARPETGRKPMLAMLQYAGAWSRWVRGHTVRMLLRDSLDTPSPLRDKESSQELAS
jgi:hypothetical protein